jgi:cation diffusion facilitator family transporter
MSSHGGNKAVVAALLANTGIAVLKFVAFLVSGASSLLAESIHSLADSGNQGLLLLGSKRAKREATPQHPFGYGRERYVYAFLVSIVLFSLGGLFALYEAYHKYHEVHAGHANELIESGYWWVAVAVLTGAIVLESFSFRTAIVESNQVRNGASWVEFVRRAKSPELPVILLEDLAALVGLALALVGVGMTLLTENGYWDVVGTGGIGVLLVVVAILLAIETKSLLLGESASDEAQELIRDRILATPGVTSVIHMRTLHLGPEELLVAAKVGVTEDASGREIATMIDAAERAVREAEPTARVIYLEPDVFEADRAPVVAE